MVSSSRSERGISHTRSEVRSDIHRDSRIFESLMEAKGYCGCPVKPEG